MQAIKPAMMNENSWADKNENFKVQMPLSRGFSFLDFLLWVLYGRCLLHAFLVLILRCSLEDVSSSTVVSGAFLKFSVSGSPRGHFFSSHSRMLVSLRAVYLKVTVVQVSKAPQLGPFIKAHD